MSAKSSLQRWKLSWKLLLIGGVLFVSLLIINSLPAWRIDFTNEKLYSLSDGSKRIIDKINEPIELKLYYSDKVTANIPQLRDYFQRVRDLLQEYQLRAGNQIELSIVDPEPFSEAEDAAQTIAAYISEKNYI